MRETRPTPDPDALAREVAQGDRRALAQAITLIESRRTDHRETAQALLGALPAVPAPTLRVGLTGTPGVGKSSFIERLGLTLVEDGVRLAVLTVDPSSERSGGSILGDKTRMERLARAPQAFIRPSPSQSMLGGVARRTRETIALVEAWGAEVVLVETVGVGQSETLVAEMTDVFALLIAPAGGDELQGVKRGVMEVADIIAVNKADGDLANEASRTCAEYAGALRLMRRRDGDPQGFPLAMRVSASTGAGVAEFWDAVRELAEARRASGALMERRGKQAQTAFLRAFDAEVLRRTHANEAVRELRAKLEEEVAAGRTSPDVAAERLTEAAGLGCSDNDASAPDVRA